jgi:5-methylcytosine-specific restriction endonuclease McrA
MTKSSKEKLAYQAAFNARPEETAKRVKNNAARRELIKEGRVKVGDKKDVDHIRPLEDGGGNARSNLRVTTEAVNRGWRKGSASYEPGKQQK